MRILCSGATLAKTSPSDTALARAAWSIVFQSALSSEFATRLTHARRTPNSSVWSLKSTQLGTWPVCLAALGYATAPALVAEKLSALMGSSSDTVLVAEDPTTGIVGVVSVHLVPLFHAPWSLARLTAVAVVPEHQRKGVGCALVVAAEAFAWQRDCRRVEVTSGDHREDAHTFYGALGYEMDERRFIKHRSSAV